MSKARPVFPGATVFSTRRVHKRQFLLKPSAIVNQIILYAAAVLSERHNLLLHALVVLANHRHDVATDPDGNIVDFQRDFHSIVARYLNHYFGEFESLWSSEPVCRVTCEEAGDILDKIGYTMANPVSSFLVKEGKNWPGVRRAWPAKPITVKRPPGFFRDEKDLKAGEEIRWPREATLRFHRPPGFEHLSDEELVARIVQAVEGKEEAARNKAEAEGIQFLGRRRVRRQSRYAYPSSSEERFGIRPQVAAKCKWARIERLQKNKDWEQRYDACVERFRAGERDVVFPYGTYKLRRYYAVRCESGPS